MDKDEFIVIHGRRPGRHEMDPLEKQLKRISTNFRMWRFKAELNETVNQEQRKAIREIEDLLDDLAADFEQYAAAKGK